MNQLTIRGFDDELPDLYAPDTGAVGSLLDHLMGTWTVEEADAIDGALQDFSRIDEAMWE